MLTVDDVQVPVQVEFGEFTPCEGPQWGGLLRDVPKGLAAAMCQGAEARLYVPGGQECTVYPAGLPRTVTNERVLLPFLGEGPIPAG
ncbi:hypothetical protein ACIRP3_41975 [Streptomyces sp. NPDC101209]|uniref:hypothetical protein n=1 Tax=Streptomyces sp. NPDC101209 TaxID=3366129 RepID=UPI0037FA18AD